MSGRTWPPRRGTPCQLSFLRPSAGIDGGGDRRQVTARTGQDGSPALPVTTPARPAGRFSLSIPERIRAGSVEPARLLFAPETRQAAARLVEVCPGARQPARFFGEHAS